MALKILKYLLKHKNFNFPFLVVCKGYGADQNFIEDNDFVEIVSKDDYENILNDKSYTEFELWENLQNIDEETLKLMSKGFIEKILS